MKRQLSVSSAPYPFISPAEKTVRDEEDPEDFYCKAGIELPSYLNTYRRRWMVLIVVAVSGAFASGPYAMWATLEPLLISEGVWAGPHQQANLTYVYSITMGISMISSLITGIIYDAVGARNIGAWGAFLTAAALVIMSLAIKIPSWNNVLWIAYPAVNVFGGANSWDVYAWLWLLPEDQNTVAAFVGAIQCVSDSLCLLAVLLNNVYGIGLPSYFIMIAGASVFAGFLALFLVPPQSDMDRISKAVAHYNATKDVNVTTVVPGTSYGATDHGNSNSDPTLKLESETPTSSDILSRTWSALKGTAVVFCRLHPGVSCLFVLYQIAQYMFSVYPMFIMYPFYTDLVGTAKAIELVDIFGGTYACIGALSLVFFGKVVDYIGLVQAIFLLNVPTVLNAALYAVPQILAQVIAQVILSFIGNVWYVLIPRFCTIYAPPEIFGTMYGVYGTLLGAFQIFLTRFGTWASGLLMLYIFHGHPPSAAPYLATIDVWCFFCVLTSVFLFVWWRYNPLPDVGSTTMEHVDNFGNENASASKLLTGPVPDRPMPPSVASSSSASCCSCWQGFGARTDAVGASGMP